MKAVFYQTLNSVFQAIAVFPAQRREMYRDFVRESRKLDPYNVSELVAALNREAVIKMEDVRHILKRLQGRPAFRFSGHDFDEYLRPVFNRLIHDIEEGRLECRVLPEESLLSGARIKVGDFLDLIHMFELPDGTAEKTKATEDVAVPVMPKISGGFLGALQKKFNEEIPLRTPSVDVRYERQETEQPLNLYRPLILAAGLAAKYREQSRIIETATIPTYKDTLADRNIRQQKARTQRTYLGNRYD